MATRSDSQAGLLARVGLPNTKSVIAVAIVCAFVLGALLSIELTSDLLIGAKDRTVRLFDWLFVFAASVSLLLVTVVALHPQANLRLGADDSKPEFSRLSWFAMLFSAGLASGLLFWSTAEPILHFQANPFLDAAGIAPGSEAAVEIALRLTVLHWGIHGWAFYVVTALAIGVYSHRRNRPLTFRSAFTPILGERAIESWPGAVIDLVALFGTVCGVATSIGLSAAGMNATFHVLFGLEMGRGIQAAIVFGVCGLGTLSALSGLDRGIRRLSELNVWVSGVLLIAVLSLGPTTVIASRFFATLIDYVVSVVPTGLWVAGTNSEQEWQAAWTVFYWGWWLAWTPFVSLFIARISKGRTIREFVVAVMLVPTLVILVWMAVFGGVALEQELADPGAVSRAVNQDYSLGLTTVLSNVATPGVSTALIAIAAFLLFTWLITSLDSATLVICHLLGVSGSNPGKIFWGTAMAAVTCALLWVGGVPALQAASIVTGLPLAVAVVVLGAGLVKDLVLHRL